MSRVAKTKTAQPADFEKLKNDMLVCPLLPLNPHLAREENDDLCNGGQPPLFFKSNPMLKRAFETMPCRKYRKHE
jgi:hypothetical protein